MIEAIYSHIVSYPPYDVLAMPWQNEPSASSFYHLRAEVQDRFVLCYLERPNIENVMIINWS